MALPLTDTDFAISASDEKLLIGARAEILPDHALPEYNTAGGNAYAARMKGSARADLIAILCNGDILPRADLAHAFRTVDNPGILRLLDSGVVGWRDGKRYFAFALERPQAPRYMIDLDQNRTPMGEDATNRLFIAPLANALQELATVGIVHNAIRPTNIFWRDAGGTPPQLGECLSVPAGIGQPALFEPVERAITPALARGQGNFVDDMYALGVCIVFVILGQNPLRGLSEAEIIRMRLERGSFHTLIGNMRLPGSHTELLRGLLADDPRQRWTASDLMQWVGGRRLTPKQAELGKRASRAFTFAGQDYFHVRHIGRALAGNVHEAAQALEAQTLDKWLRRSLGDEEKAEDLTYAVESLQAATRTSTYEDQLVTRACIALDPSGPIMYRGLTVMPTGIGPLLAETLRKEGDVQTIADLIATQIVGFWLNMQKEAKVDLVPFAQSIERMRGFIEKPGLGNGIERITYELNPSLPCLSPMTQGQYVLAARDLLYALEKASMQPNRAREPMDRHIAAWLIARDRRSEHLFRAFGTNEPTARRALAMLALFSEMQSRHGPEKLPGLAQWLLAQLEPAVKRFHNRNFQEEVRTTLRSWAEQGDLGRMLYLLDDPRIVENDERGFTAARVIYLGTVKEIADMEHQIRHPDDVTIKYGRPAATYVGSMLGAILIIFGVLRAIAS